ncbi:unnamed protein product [Lepidochelys kempii]
MLSGPSPSPSCLAHGECGHYTTQKSLAELGWSKVSKNADPAAPTESAPMLMLYPISAAM